jgi:hypothetical protein
VVVGAPPGACARLLRPAPPPGDLPALPMRAVAIVLLELPVGRLTPEPWIQVDHPNVPFARMYEPANWSPALGEPGRTAVGMECYCRADETDPVWSLPDGALAARCARSLAEPLGLLDPALAAAARPIRVLRMARAYPVVDRDRVAEAALPRLALEAVRGVHLAQGGAVIEAVEAGEAAAARCLAEVAPVAA